MLDILIVEDNEKKLNKIKEILEDNAYFIKEKLDIATTINQAKEYLRNNQYDLMLLDIQIPKMSGEKALVEGGLEVLKSLKSPKQKTPNHIIGMTAHDESAELAAIDFDENLYQLIRYDETTNEWSKKLENKMNHIGGSKAGELNKSNQYKYDIAIICALEDPELKSILNLNDDWKKINLVNDDANDYHTTTFKDGEKEITVIASSPSQMGMVASATLTTKMISEFKPRYLFMTGIAAGVKGKNEYGDVIVADISWDYTSGKIEMIGEDEVLTPDPYPLRLSSKFKKIANNISRDDVLLATIKSKWNADKPVSSLNVHVGDVASGGAVIESQSVIEGIKKHARKIIGIEMEAYGVYFASDNSLLPKPETMVLKSVCDFADKNKNDNFQKYAAYTSAQVMYHIIMNELSFD